MTDRHGGHLLAERLKAHGVGVVFTLCGNHTLTIYQGLYDEGIELVDCRTEAGAVMAADAYARATRSVGVALVTGGPGHTNALTGLITAHASGSPVLLLSGQTDLALSGKGAQQEIEQVAIAAPLCKYSKLLTNIDDLPELVDTAFNSSLSGTTGASHLSLPSDVIAKPVNVGKASTHIAAPVPPARHTGQQVTEVLDNLRSAARPVIIAGSGAYMGKADDPLERLVSHTNIPLFTIDLARGIVADSHPAVLGYADASLNVRARHIADADVVLLLGKTLDFRLRFGGPSVIAADATLIDIHAPGSDVDANRERQLIIEADISTFVDELAEKAALHEWDAAWLRKASSSPKMSEPPPPVGAPPFHPHTVAHAISEALPEDVSLVFDGGDFVQWCRMELDAPGPGRWIRLGPMSTCGAGTPLAIGLKKAQPDRPVILMTGDGSFGYYLIEFEAALRQSLPFVAIVGHNNAWGLERNLQRGLYGEDYMLASKLSPTPFNRVIEALGGYGELVTDLDELPTALGRALASGKPACLQIPVSLDPSPLTQAVISRGGEV